MKTGFSFSDTLLRPIVALQPNSTGLLDINWASSMTWLHFVGLPV
jgi:hypothetical protein